MQKGAQFYWMSMGKPLQVFVLGVTYSHVIELVEVQNKERKGRMLEAVEVDGR